MSRRGQDFIGLLTAQHERPRSHFWGPAAVTSMIRDQLTVQTWLAIGAAVQAVFYWAIGSYAFLPAYAYLLLNIIDATAMATGWKHNTHMDGVIMQKHAAQIPDELGNYGNKPCASNIVVLLIGAKSNHPFGALAPGYKQLGAYFASMAQSLEDHAEEFGFLGMTSWLNSSDHTSKSETMWVCYFRTVEGLHAFAHSPHHRPAWTWFDKDGHKMPHISIWHETYHVPAGHWETIYAQSQQVGINSTTFKVTDQETGEPRWVSPVVDASKGLLKTSAGRMARSDGKEHDAYEERLDSKA